MIEVLYRIYEVSSVDEQEEALRSGVEVFGFNSISKMCNKELTMDCLVCDSREQFKSIIRDEYGENISFRFSKNLKAGDLYCIIIGEHCYDTERYFQKISFVCDNCGSQVTTYLKRYIEFDNYEVEHYFFNIPDYRTKKFCCQRCKEKYRQKETKKLSPEQDTEFFVTRDMFSNECAGYVYKISKKSTGEFYIGQTVYAPVFRWGQHLKTERFPISSITDYQFEVLEIVPKDENILEREKYYIQKYYKENPEKSLNIAGTTNIKQ